MSQLPHGITGYDRYGCRCGVCSSAKSAKNSSRTRTAKHYDHKLSPSEAGRLGAQASKATTDKLKRERIAAYNLSPVLCKACSKPIPYDKHVYNNSVHCDKECRRLKMFSDKKCVECGTILPRRRSGKLGDMKYCSHKCQVERQHKVYVEKWLVSEMPGGSWCGVSDHVKRWLTETRGNKCEECGWDKKHPVSGRVPVQVDHIDGDPYNHRPENLKLLCPNCHSLTTTFGNYNRGKGRKERYNAPYAERAPHLNGNQD